MILNQPNLSEQPKYLVHYLRDFNRIPFGCIVAISPDNIGVSVCNPKDRFNKKFARRIALGRAMSREKDCNIAPKNRFVLGYYGEDDPRTWEFDEMSIFDYVEDAVAYVKGRAQKYFKENC
jgi:hypothetical protein